MSVFTQAGGGANQLDTGYEISNSLRFNDDDSPNLTERPASGNRKTFTFSTWFKRSNLKSSGEMFLLGGSSDGATDHTEFKLQNDQLTFIIFDGSSNTSYIRTTAKLRDVSAWYHVVFRIDLTQATNTDRIRLYINGVLQTSLDQTTYDAQNNDSFMSLNNGYHRIGADARSAANFFDGYMAETYYIDGQSYDPTYFGKFDDNNVWIPVEPGTGDGGSITYGTNGFLLEYKQTGTSANSSGIGADTSGQDNHLTPTNFAAIDVTEDTCTNNFMTLNSVLADGQFNSDQLSEGNTFYNEGQGNNGDGQPTGTFAFNSGKWYWEVQVPSQQNSRAIGFCRMDRVSIDQPPQLHGNGFTATNSVVGIDLTDDTIDQVDNAGSHTQHASGLTGMSDNDIFGVAVNLDDGNFQFYRNGSTYGSSYSLSNLSEWQEHGAVPCASGKTYQAYRFNFGNPAFSISSGNNDGKYGNFEYAPPSGYYALCTKRLAAFG